MTTEVSRPEIFFEFPAMHLILLSECFFTVSVLASDMDIGSDELYRYGQSSQWDPVSPIRIGIYW